jgi:tellurium resistance protein TerD
MVDILDTKFEGKEIKLEDNKVKIGDEVNLTALDPRLRKILVGAGWDMNAFNADALDVDLSVFLIDKNEMTRVDEDFVFYNNTEACAGAVRHGGDSTTGAGDGDDESIAVDLQEIPFDVMRLLFVVSIYKGEEKEQNVGMIRNAYLRIASAESGHEYVRYDMTPDLQDKTETAVVAAVLNREGPKWHFKPVGEYVEGGLAAIAKRYGLIIAQQ